MADLPPARCRSPRLSAAVLGVLAVIAAVGPKLLGLGVDTYVQTGSFPIWLPTADTVGETVVLYGSLLDLLTFVGLPVAFLWLGYTLGVQHATRETTAR